jgi:hypothetical protein
VSNSSSVSRGSPLSPTNRSDLITTQHLSRRALVYIRQSSPQQVLTNQESLRLQYALRQRAQDLGWPPERIEVIDTDLVHHHAAVSGIVRCGSWEQPM